MSEQRWDIRDFNTYYKGSIVDFSLELKGGKCGNQVIDWLYQTGLPRFGFLCKLALENGGIEISEQLCKICASDSRDEFFKLLIVYKVQLFKFKSIETTSQANI